MRITAEDALPEMTNALENVERHVGMPVFNERAIQPFRVVDGRDHIRVAMHEQRRLLDAIGKADGLDFFIE